MPFHFICHVKAIAHEKPIRNEIWFKVLFKGCRSFREVHDLARPRWQLATRISLQIQQRFAEKFRWDCGAKSWTAFVCQASKHCYHQSRIFIFLKLNGDDFSSFRRYMTGPHQKTRLRLFVSVYTRYITAQTSKAQSQRKKTRIEVEFFFFLVVVGAQL